MEVEKLHTVLTSYGFSIKEVQISSIGTGLINETYKLIYKNEEFILQKINSDIFKFPHTIDDNVKKIAAFLKNNYPDYFFTTPLPNQTGHTLVKIGENEYYRVFSFFKNSHSKQVVNSPGEAFEAAAQFGKFTNCLSNFDANNLEITLPDFHNLSLRYEQFLSSLKTARNERLSQASELIELAKEHSSIVQQYETITKGVDFKIRVTHHDTKISNVLFNHDDKAICVIDLDTVMPGYFISDVGDMIRTYICPLSEEETDFSNIKVRKEYYDAIVTGYNGEMQSELTAKEQQFFQYAGSFMIYMQAIRFLTDYLNNDSYYGAKYELHNYNRAKNQFTLLLQYHQMIEH